MKDNKAMERICTYRATLSSDAFGKGEEYE